VVELLRLWWSPEQIAVTLRAEHLDDAYWWVSHESIYRAIYVQTKGALKAELVACLRRSRSHRKPRGRPTGIPREVIPDPVSISKRPPEAEDRSVPGHWEGDLIVGKGNRSFVATLVERSTRFGMLVKVDSKDAAHVADRLAHAARRLPNHLAKSLTWDRGREMTNHHSFTISTGVWTSPVSPDTYRVGSWDPGSGGVMPAPKPPEFRRRAVELAREGLKPIAQVARDLGISESGLRRWMAQADVDEGKREGLTTAEREELSRLRRENRVLRMERDLLSRAAAFFAQENVLPR
jgi:IS30 family transposase